MTEYFLDTYALHEIEEGSENYVAYSAELGIVTTKLNLMELYHNYFKLKGLETAEMAFEHFKEFCRLSGIDYDGCVAEIKTKFEAKL